MKAKNQIGYVYITCEVGENSKLEAFEGSVGWLFNLLWKVRKLWMK